VVVVGSGVIGLTIACKLQETGKYRVSIVAENTPCELPAEAKESTDWASPWAGAHWRAWADNQNTELQDIETRTYLEMLEIARQNSTAGISIAQGTDLFENLPGGKPWYKSIVHNPVEISTEDLPNDVVYGLQYTTLLINVPVYIRYLRNRFLSLGGKITKQRIEHIQDALQFVPNYLAAATLPIVVNCTGLGSRNLGGVNDNMLYPVRGQTLLVNAPAVRCTITRVGKCFGYVIPRGDGTVIIGGTADKHQWDCQPSAKDSKTIISRALSLEPALLPINQKTMTEKQKIKALEALIISTNVGLRPMRNGSVRIEAVKSLNKNGSLFNLVHCYGHGGFGYQSSLGYAEKILNLINH
ncbi:nucleotide-binding domain-containing protein, partial [Coemansia reversa NRRL 1564]